MEYRNRIADGLLERKLKGIGAVLIEGPKLCGKNDHCGTGIEEYFVSGKSG